jgi:regulator of sigma E protease
MPIVYVIEAIVALGFMIFIHEGGHYLACRLFKVDVDEFALGFGFGKPPLVSRKWGNTLYSIYAFPLGGYCKPKGGDLSGESAGKMYEKAPEPGEFLYASWWKRVVIFLAGPAMNFFSAVAFLFLVLLMGVKTPIEEPVLGFVQPHSLAYECGFQKGDRLLQADGKDIQNLFTDMDGVYDKLTKDPKSTAVLKVERGGKTFNLTLKNDSKDPNAAFGFFNFNPPVIGSVALMTPARKAGLQANDTVVSVNGQKITEWNELAYYIHTAVSDPIKLEILRGSKTLRFSIGRIDSGLSKNKAIGISPLDSTRFEIKKVGVGEAFIGAWERAADFSVMYMDLLGKMVTGRISLKDNIGGPISIMRVMYQKASEGWDEFIGMVATISLILCLMNLLPFLGVVDGGQVVLCLVEGVIRKPVSVKFQEIYQKVGFALVFTLILFAVGNDLWGWILERVHSQIP